MKTKKQNDKIVNIDLWIKGKAKKEDWERYDGLLLVYCNFLFQNKIGTWGVRETAIGKTSDGLLRGNYYYVLEKETTKAVSELKRMIKNFRLTSVTKVKVGNPIESKTDYKTKFEKEKEFSWTYIRFESGRSKKRII